MLYPNAYVWFLFVASLDIVLTYLILHPLFSSPQVFALDRDDDEGPVVVVTAEERGREVNALADKVIQRYDVPGMVVYKFLLVVLVIGICEVIGRRRSSAGRRLAEWAVAISTIPVVVALVQMGMDLRHWFHPPG